MYLRFIGPFPTEGESRVRNCDYGLFQTAFRARDDYLIEPYLVDEFMREMDWFKEHLPSPDSDYFDAAGVNVGICWFRDHAKTMIRRARHMVNILSAGDIWVTEARTNSPGQILYWDDYQIIAQPRKGTPTKWGQTKKHFRR